MMVGLIVSGTARTWTDVTGRKIEAEIVSVEGDQVLLLFNGKKVPLDLARLSNEDQEFIKEWAVHQTATETDNSGELELCGTPLKTGGAVNVIEEPLSATTLKEFSKASDKPGKLRLAVALPDGFDPSKPQYVMWVSAAINNEGERKRGNTGAIGRYAKVATEAGWVVIAADTDQGNPRLEDNQKATGGDLAVHTEAIEILSKAWPGFKASKFACCGFSGGAKATFYRAGDLLVSDLEVIGMFLGGCNQDMTDDARDETRFRKAGLRKIRVFISNGKDDKISSVAHATAVKDSVKSNGYGDVRLELFEGGHQMDNQEFLKAMAWFKEAPKK